MWPLQRSFSRPFPCVSLRCQTGRFAHARCYSSVRHALWLTSMLAPLSFSFLSPSFLFLSLFVSVCVSVL